MKIAVRAILYFCTRFDTAGHILGAASVTMTTELGDIAAALTGTSSLTVNTGGSVIYKEKAMAHLAQTATIIYLCVDLEILAARLSDVVERGVAMDPGKGIDDLYKERTPLYDKFCDIKIDCGVKSPSQVVSAIEHYLR